MDSENKETEAPIDGTDEARALAAAAREAAKRKHDEVVKPEESQASVKKSRKAPAPRTKTSTHTVAVPDGFAPDVQRDEAVYGGLPAAAGAGGSSSDASSNIWLNIASYVLVLQGGSLTVSSGLDVAAINLNQQQFASSCS
jgi:hypothetical protein